MSALTSQSGAASAPHGAASGAAAEELQARACDPTRRSPGTGALASGGVVSSQNLAGAASAAPAPLREGTVWSRQDEARLLDLHGECDGDWRKVATKLQRTTLECRVRYRQLMMLKPAKVEVERKCLFCQRVKMIEKPMRICSGCRETEEWRNASAWA